MKKKMGNKIFIIFLNCIAIFILFSIISCQQPSNDDGTVDIKTWEKEIPSDYSINHNVWDNAIVYFVITDRFFNGNSLNDTSYNREHATNTAGHFYGGDLAGLTQKINSGYFNDLTIDAIWITAPYEQIHGWVVGGSLSPYFKHYSYHGYYPLDYTKLDKNMGNETELKEFIDTAHSRGIRVILDVVMNHPGYSNIVDLNEFGVNVLKTGWESATLLSYHNYIDYSAEGWYNWWGADWVRAGLGPEPRDGIDGRYEAGPSLTSDSLKGSLNYLPDFKTESTKNVGLPSFYKNKIDTNAKFNDNFTVRDYIINWLIEWVKTYGVDGFRCDTAKHVEKEAWYKLKVGSTYALREWKKNNPTKKVDDSDFWMTGEVFDHGVIKDDYYTVGGFNSLINFSFQSTINNYISSPSTYENDLFNVYNSMATSINSDDDFNVLSYISSHDTYLFYSGGKDQNGITRNGASSDFEKQKTAGSLLLLSPGAVQIFYGDECGRPKGTYQIAGDNQQVTRSQMIFDGDTSWTSANTEILSHWSKISKFRKKHIAIGDGSHQRIGATSPFTFSRIKDTDKVICVIGASGVTEVSTTGIFTDGDVLTDFYTGNSATVSNGKVSFTANINGVILIEKN